MDNPPVEEPSPPQSVHDSEDESIPGSPVDSHFFPYGTRSLIEAVLESDIHEIRRILENPGVDVDEKGPHGRTALSFAIEKCKYKAVKLLLDKGADPNTREDQNRTPFFWAATTSQFDYYVGYNDMIQSLLQARADPNLTDDQGDTSLAVAAARGNQIFVQLVVGSGLVKINTGGNEETSPLMRAAAGGWPKCMVYLLPRGPDMGSCTWWERFLKTRSQRKKEPESPDPFQWPKPHLEDPRSLVEKIALWSMVLPDGRTFLSWAVEFQDEEIVKLLLDFKADPDIRDTTEHQITPLINALKLGNMTLVDLLKEKDKRSMHILVEQADDTSESQALELARKLLGQGYDLSRTDLTGQNLVHVACYQRKKHFVEAFLHQNYKNSSIHHKDNSGKTPLQYAIDNEDIVKLLVEDGAKLSDVPTECLFEPRQPKPHCVQ